MWIVSFLILLIVSTLLFVLRYYQDRRDAVLSGRPRSLNAVVMEVARMSTGASPKKRVLKWLFLLAICLVFLPPFLIPQARILAEHGGGWLRAAMVVQGLLLFVGYGATLLAIVVSDMSIGFGSPARTTRNTPLVWLIPIYEIGAGLAAIAAAIFL